MKKGTIQITLSSITNHTQEDDYAINILNNGLCEFKNDKKELLDINQISDIFNRIINDEDHLISVTTVNHEELQAEKRILNLEYYTMGIFGKEVIKTLKPAIISHPKLGPSKYSSVLEYVLSSLHINDCKKEVIQSTVDSILDCYLSVD